MADSTKSFEAVIADQVAYWQQVLRLQDWNVDARVARAHEMVGDQQPIAQCDIYEQRKDAVLRVLHPMDLPTVSQHFLFGEEKDYDLSIVHELMHLHFQPFQSAADTAQGLAQEQCIETVSRALLRLYREARPMENASVLPPSTDAVSHGHYV